MTAEEFLKEKQKEIEEIRRLIREIKGIEPEPTLDESTEGLSEKEKAFLKIEKKYKPQILKRESDIRFAKSKVEKLNKQIGELEEKRSQAASSNDVYSINLKISVMIKQLEEVETELENIENGEEGKAFERLLNEKIERDSSNLNVKNLKTTF